MRGSTFLLRPSSFDRRNTEKIFLFVSLSLSDFFSFLPLFSSHHFSFFFLPPYHRTSPFLFAHTQFPFPFLFIFSLIFSSLYFSLLFLFLHFLFSISHLDCINRMFKTGENFPSLSFIATCHHHHFSLNFLIFLFPLFLSFDTWLNVSHSHKCTT